MEWWQELRAQFPVTGKCTYMDTAFDCGGSLIGKAAAARYFDDWAEAASHGIKGGPGRKPFFEVAAAGRESLAKLMGVSSANNIAYTKNTNEGINAVIQGFMFRPGENIVTVDREYPSVMLPCLNAERTKGVECRFVELGNRPYAEPDELLAMADEHTAIIALSHVQSSTGYKSDLAYLGAQCRKRGIFLLTDAVQSLGLSQFCAEEWGVDAVSGACYKGLGGIISAGFLYCSDALLERIWPVYVSNNFGMHASYEHGRPEIVIRSGRGALKLENCSTDYLGVYVLEAAVSKLVGIGMDRIEAHVDEMFEMLYDGLSAEGYKLITPRDKAHRCASIAAETENGDGIKAHFYANGVIVSAGGDTFRASVGAYTSPEDVRRTVEVAASCPVR